MIFSVSALFASTCVLLFEMTRYNEAKEKCTQNQLIATTMHNIKIENICLNKSTEKLFAPKSLSLKNDIKKLDQYKLIESIDIKNDKISIIIESNYDKLIMQLISDLSLKLNGLVHFESIKCINQNNKVRCKIEFYVTYYSNTNLKKSVMIHRRGSTTKTINLFKENRTHKLLAIANNSHAFINNSWFKNGDIIDHDNIIDVNQNSIKIKRLDEVITIHVGEKW